MQLNAFDKRHLDEINFDVRFTEFQAIMSHIKEMQTVDVNYLIPVMHNCFYNMEVRSYSTSVQFVSYCFATTATLYRVSFLHIFFEKPRVFSKKVLLDAEVLVWQGYCCCHYLESKYLK